MGDGVMQPRGQVNVLKQQGGCLSIVGVALHVNSRLF